MRCERVIKDPNLVWQFRKPRSKKKRIKNKWAKNPDNYRPSYKFWYVDGMILCHPCVYAAYEEMRQTIKDEAEAGMPYPRGTLSWLY